MEQKTGRAVNRSDGEIGQFEKSERRYEEKDLVRIAGRENNKKRPYLVVNPLQGKHVPVAPSGAFTLFEALAEEVKRRFPGERLFLIGFAETATAIGAAVAASCHAPYMQTTREQAGNGEYLFFSEEHSHATEQRLVKEALEAGMRGADRLVFVEDELTTGRTIRNLAAVLRKTYPLQAFRFGAASLLNGMSAEATEECRAEGIAFCFLVKSDHAEYEKRALSYKGDGMRHPVSEFTGFEAYEEMRLSGAQDPRCLVAGEAYRDACKKLWERIERRFSVPRGSRILVLGTEECMYPALTAGYLWERAGCEVLCHATTRSPILPGREADSPLHVRYELESFYEKGRVTYIYELGAYDRVFVITDAKSGELRGERTLVSALWQAGNRQITIVRWQKE